MAERNLVVLVTCGSAREARRLARALVGKKLAACVNMTTSPIRSVYWWKGKVQSATEVLLLIKTTRRRFADLEKDIRRRHSYETPEIIALPMIAGSRGYLNWLRESLKP